MWGYPTPRLGAAVPDPLDPYEPRFSGNRHTSRRRTFNIYSIVYHVIAKAKRITGNKSATQQLYIYYYVMKLPLLHTCFKHTYIY
jgi:hypothetical protein